MNGPRKLAVYEYMNVASKESFIGIFACRKYSVFIAESRYIYVSTKEN
jgi:hypothetical protein